ncbi:hypothetical protein BABINDRAFT_95065 [Babjeviella inositovora NRRL Y-12698]|uniref:COX assembly mitochondrial protein n=1 Tax=Babjeviella inositovora NRRL Y-12698 TaxID=984486 RepID=A0A1E3QJM6_9ASCO|nr:uncharacterized protein BABINDRAFT_95065 [Babjeviella inositovora NRRL Y-12698]ODQ77896.1 hypothetical protein BABINDRAFT_95065 [Babjeviella inositovora NRRL Y-12698]
MLAERNKSLPIWVLTPKEEKVVRENWKKNSWKKCDELARIFNLCAKANTFNVTTACTVPKEMLYECVYKYNTPEYMDIERDLFIREKLRKMEEEVNSRKAAVQTPP